MKIFGYDHKDLSLSTLRSQIFHLNEYPILFNGKYRDNIDPKHEFEDEKIYLEISDFEKFLNLQIDTESEMSERSMQVNGKRNNRTKKVRDSKILDQYQPYNPEEVLNTNETLKKFVQDSESEKVNNKVIRSLNTAESDRITYYLKTKVTEN